MLKFGIFDHLDGNGSPLGAFFEDRLRLVELIEQEGYYAYHLAEHHSTPLGCVPSPSVFLSAAIQRSKRIRLGPLVYVLPLYHPPRLYEEICMLDHLSNGRLMLGVGRGGALHEHRRYGVDPAAAPAMYHEAFAVLLKAFACDVVNFDGKFFKYKDFVVQAKPLQRPHPADLLRRAQRRRHRLGGAARRQCGVARAGIARARHQRPLPPGMGRARAQGSRSADDWHHPAHRRGQDR